jgi:hypothetical protein
MGHVEHLPKKVYIKYVSPRSQLKLYVNWYYFFTQVLRGKKPCPICGWNFGCNNRRSTAAGISWKISFSKFVKKKSQSKKKLEKISKNILKLERKRMGSFKMYENTGCLFYYSYTFKKNNSRHLHNPLNKLNKIQCSRLWKNFAFLIQILSRLSYFPIFLYFVEFCQNTCSCGRSRWSGHGQNIEKKNNNPLAILLLDPVSLSFQLPQNGE